VLGGGQGFLGRGLEERSDGGSGLKKGGGISYGDGALGKGVGERGRRRSPEGPARGSGWGGGAGTGPGRAGPAGGRGWGGRRPGAGFWG
jgi:hypothetical protein